MPAPSHDGDWFHLGDLVAKAFKDNVGRLKADIYRKIAIENNANPVVVQRCHAAFVLTEGVARSSTELAEAIRRLPLSISEVILRWAGYDQEQAIRQARSYEAGRIGLRDLRTDERMARERQPDQRRKTIAHAEASAADKVMKRFGGRKGFRIVPIDSGRRTGRDAVFAELVGTPVDYVAEWGDDKKERLALTVLSVRPGDPRHIFRHRIQLTLWCALGMIHLGWRAIVVVVGDYDLEPFRKWLGEQGISEAALEIQSIPGSALVEEAHEGNSEIQDQIT